MNIVLDITVTEFGHRAWHFLGDLLDFIERMWPLWLFLLLIAAIIWGSGAIIRLIPVPHRPTWYVRISTILRRIGAILIWVFVALLVGALAIWAVRQFTFQSVTTDNSNGTACTKGVSATFDTNNGDYGIELDHVTYVQWKDDEGTTRYYVFSSGTYEFQNDVTMSGKATAYLGKNCSVSDVRVKLGKHWATSGTVDRFFDKR